LNTVSERVHLMKLLYSVDEVYVLPFDESLSTMPWEPFAQMLMQEFQAKHIVCGHDYRFGAKGEGNAEKMADFCRQNQIGFDRIEQVCLDGVPISSTYIRTLLLQGEVSAAERFLGHPHLLSGEVVGGKKVGRTLGIPTANLQLSNDVIVPKNGVYAAETFFDAECYVSVVNIGNCPTFQGQTVTIEPWLLDFSGDLYGKHITLALHAYLREERKFDTKEALQKEVHSNAKTARALLGKKNM